jgi:cellulase/cellobiase CelA1
VVSQWPGGFQGDVTVHNDLAEPASAWAVTLDLGGGQQITQGWNATVTQSGSTVTARNASWNGGLAAGATTSFGFQASGIGSANASVVTCAAAR